MLHPTMSLSEAYASLANVVVIATFEKRGNPLVAFDKGATLVVGKEGETFRAVWLKPRTAEEVNVNQDIFQVGASWKCPNGAFKLYWDSLKAQGHEIREVEPQKVWEVDLLKATLAFTTGACSVNLAQFRAGVTRFEVAAVNCDLSQDLGDWLGD